MRKKLISLVLAVSMVLGLTACGGNSPCTITIEGKKYDLSDDFQDVVSEMVKNDISVVAMMRMMAYDEDGKFVQMDMNDIGAIRCYAEERPVVPMPDNHIIVARYEIGTGEIDFKTAQGITDNSSSRTIRGLDGYVPQMGLYIKDDETYAAMYIDGKIVDLQDYEDVFEDWVEEAEDSGIAVAIKEYLPNSFYFPASSRFLSNNALWQWDVDKLFEEKSYYIKEDLLIAFAAQEAGEMLEDGKIESYDIILYEDRKGDEMIVSYYHYFYDEDWDMEKFRAD